MRTTKRLSPKAAEAWAAYSRAAAELSAARKAMESAKAEFSSEFGRAMSALLPDGTVVRRQITTVESYTVPTHTRERFVAG